MKRITCIWPGVIVAALLVGLASLSSASTQLLPSEQHQQATELVTQLMARFHYRRAALDDALSSRVMDRYLQTLDPNKLYFLSKDIAVFSTHRTELDDSLRNARLEPAFAIFDVFRTRVRERSDHALKLLQNQFDFKLDESYVFDRSELKWASDKKALDEIWRKRVKNDYLGLVLAGQERDAIVDTLRKRYNRLVRRVDQLNEDDVYQSFINSYTLSVEPHTEYFTPRNSDNFQIRMSLSLEGIGAVLQLDNEHTLVRRIVPGGPADESTLLHSGDRITGVAQGEKGEVVDVVGWRLDDVVELIRGPKDSVVRLQILPKETGLEGPANTITLVRNKIKLEEQAAQKSLLEITEGDITRRIGVIVLPTFYLDFAAVSRGDENYRSTTRDVRRIINELSEEGIDGLLVDLRDNGGGSLAEATELTGLFIESGPIVQVRDSDGDIDIKQDPDPGIAYTGPLAVLVNRFSASASEIFAGAIQDYRRGVVVGEPTFGKGTVQNLFDLDRHHRQDELRLGQLKVTIAQFFRINGSSTQHRGVVPDIVFPTALDSDDQGERALENALPWATVHPAQYNPREAMTEAIEVARQRHKLRIAADPAFRLLLEETESQMEARDKAQVTLLEATRRKDQDTSAHEQRQRTNRYRIAVGLAPIADTAEPTAEDGPSSDILLDETSHILSDLIDTLRQDADTLRAANEDGAEIAVQ
ncbi:MAG: carboxy terminal-processing peptidase [Gammaproteobacteria bacterium]|nr:carboxy terminal-processing peptidase [Gammaproteobacteria bacterium]